MKTCHRKVDPVCVTIDNQRNGLETHAKVDATSVIRFVWNPVTSL
jgi:hypothetical protein